MGVTDDHRVDRRVLERVGDVEDRSDPRRARRVADRVEPEVVPWWMTTTWTFTPSFRRRSDSALIRAASGRNVSPAVAPRRDELGRVQELGADDADLDAVDGEDRRRRRPRTGRCRSRSRRCSWPGTGSARVPAARAAGSTPKSNSWLPYDVASRPHGFSTSIVGMSSSSAEFGGEAPTLSPPARISPGPGSAARSSSNIVASWAAPPTGTVDAVDRRCVVGPSWPWKSLSPTIEIGL